MLRHQTVTSKGNNAHFFGNQDMTRKLNAILVAGCLTSGTFIAAVGCAPSASPHRVDPPVTAASTATTLATAPAATVAGPPTTARGARGGVVLVAATSPSATAPAATRGGGAITLGPDDKQVFPEPPAGFNAKRDNIMAGKLTVVPYESKTLGTRRNLYIYTPAGYSPDRKYPALYLLHGLGGDYNEWLRYGAEHVLNNLIADGKMVPMIVIFPNGDTNITAENQATAAFGLGRGGRGGRAAAGARGGTGGGTDSWGAPFENDLLKDIIPFVESKYPIIADREHRALAGLSMGGGQTLNIGLSHLDTFAWVAGMAAAPNSKAPAQLVPDAAAVKDKLKLLWISCGNKDGLIRISQGFHAYFKEKGIPHIWNVDGHGHDGPEFAANLYHMAPHLFK